MADTATNWTPKCAGKHKPGRRPSQPRESRPCGRCGQALTRPGYVHRDAAEWFCSRAHYDEWRTTRRGAMPAVCRQCGRATVHPNRTRYKTFDRETNTYLCERCQHPRASKARCRRKGCKVTFVSWPSHPRLFCSKACYLLHKEATRRLRRVTCANPECRKGAGGHGPRVRELRLSVAARQRFCSRSCAVAYGRRHRLTGSCGYCSEPIPNGKRFCDRAHYVAWLRSRAVAHSQSLSPGEARVRQAWERGVRGWNHLRKAARVSLRDVRTALGGRDIGSDSCGGCGAAWCPKSAAAKSQAVEETTDCR